jgi:RNA polymerase sigma-70 factor, ECF subfamily
MLQIHRARGNFIAGAEVTPWAFTIARHLLVDRSRRGAPPGRIDSRELETRAADVPRADDLVNASQLAIRLEHAVAELPHAQRVAFELVRTDGLTFNEAALMLGTTVGAAKARVQRAYETLRSELSAEKAGLRRGAR